MQGIALSRSFFADIVQPWLSRVAPELRYSAALSGYGSELLGFDDDLSKDHNWGPRVHIIVGQDDFAPYARRLVEDFTSIAPTSFAGEPIAWRSRPHPPASGAGAFGAAEHGLEVHTLEGLLAISSSMLWTTSARSVGWALPSRSCWSLPRALCFTMTETG